ncbi:MAG: type II secretion system major pseudopilin GspG [Planctomycetota bacterium]
MPTKTNTRQRNRRGFTLIEAIVIIVIIGVIAAVVAPRLLSRVGQSRTAVAESNASSLATAMKLYFADHGKPEDGATIDILFERPADIEEADYEPYLDNADQLLDPWGNKFVLVIPGQENFDFDIVSYGADGQPGGEGEDGDIVKP